jgi:hypothetical protein
LAAVRRSASRGRRVESTINLRPPPVMDPNAMRRGSAPDTAIHRRRVPVQAAVAQVNLQAPLPHIPLPQASMPHVPLPQVSATRPRSSHRLLPRLSTHQGTPAARGPLSAPPTTNQAHVNARLDQLRSETRASTREKTKEKLRCVVM